MSRLVLFCFVLFPAWLCREAGQGFPPPWSVDVIGGTVLADFENSTAFHRRLSTKIGS